MYLKHICFALYFFYNPILYKKTNERIFFFDKYLTDISVKINSI